MKSLYRLDQFDRVLALRNRDGLPHLLIGSQAVKFWAGLFADQGIGPSRTEAVHQRRHGLQRRPGRCRTHCSATEAPRGSTREGWNDRPGRLHPLHMGRHRVQHRSRPSGSWCASEPGEPGDPGRGERSNPSGHGPGLPVCLEVGALLHGFSREPARHPAPESLSENSEGSCGEGIWRWPRRRGRSIPEEGCNGRVNAGHRQKTRRPKGFLRNSPLSSLLVGHRPIRVCSLLAPRHRAVSEKTGPL